MGKQNHFQLSMAHNLLTVVSGLSCLVLNDGCIRPCIPCMASMDSQGRMKYYFVAWICTLSSPHISIHMESRPYDIQHGSALFQRRLPPRKAKQPNG